MSEGTESAGRPPVGYVGRIADAEIAALLAELPALSIEGAKAVGKTRSALSLAATTWRLEDPATLELVRAC